MPSMTVILLSSEENEFSLLCFHILIYCLTTGKSGAETPLFLLKSVSSLPVASSRCENLRIAHNRILKHVESEHGSVVCHYDYRFERSYQTNRFSLHGYGI